MLVALDSKRLTKIIGEKGLPWNLSAVIPEAAEGLVKILQTGTFDTIFTNVCGSFSAFGHTAAGRRVIWSSYQATFPLDSTS
mmetsp:Transcript_16591/g.38346  ORF Transcript_16591/g.38346 Transcript_16591/m.38346 type:complete len:82 (-) Transcript_16591:443-688(-)